MVSAGNGFSLLLKYDGTVIARGNAGRQWSALDEHADVESRRKAIWSRRTCTIPTFPNNWTCTQIAAGGGHSLLLMSAGEVLAFGNNGNGQCQVPSLAPHPKPYDGTQLAYTQVDAGGAHSLLLRSDGKVEAFGWNSSGQCEIPDIEEGMEYTKVAAGGAHSLLLKKDGTVTACGMNSDGRCDIPALPPGLRYTHVAASGPALPPGLHGRFL